MCLNKHDTEFWHAKELRSKNNVIVPINIAAAVVAGYARWELSLFDQAMVFMQEIQEENANKWFSRVVRFFLGVLCIPNPFYNRRIYVSDSCKTQEKMAAKHKSMQNTKWASERHETTHDDESQTHMPV